MSAGAEGKFVVFFRLYKKENRSAYASFSHLPNCDDCKVDSDGHKILIQMIYHPIPKEKKVDSISNWMDRKLVLAEFYDDSDIKCVIIYKDKSKTKASLYRIYKDSESEEKLLPISKSKFKVADTGALYRLDGDQVEYVHTTGSIGDVYKNTNI